MKKQIIKLTESDLHKIIRESVKKILKEDVLGNNWHESDDEPFENKIERFKAEDEFRNQHDWATQGEEEFDPTFYDDPDMYRDDVIGWNGDPSDNDLYNSRW